jgi:hypothetical protein
MGWASPTASQFAVNLQGNGTVHTSPTRSATEALPAESSKEELATELASLKAMMAVMSNRLSQAEANATPKTPPMTQTVRPQTTPRKRTGSFAVSPSKRQQSVAPSQVGNSQGTIEAMWSPGVTPEQRRSIFDNKMHFTGPTTGAMSPPSFTTPNLALSPAAISNTSATPTRKPAARKSRTTAAKKTPAPKKSPAPKKTPASKKAAKVQPQHQRTQSAPSLPTFNGVNIDALKLLTPQAPRPGDRSISELYKANFMSLGVAEKARLLLPLLEGNDPATGKKWAEPGSSGREMLASSPPTFSSVGFGSDPFMSSPLPAGPGTSHGPIKMAPSKPIQSLPSQAPAQAPLEKTGIPSYSNFNTWYAGLEREPVTQTATKQASADSESRNNLPIQTPGFTQAGNEGSVLTPSLIQPLVKYVQSGEFYTPSEQVDTISTSDGSSNNLLKKFNTQHTPNKQITSGDTEITEFNLSDFINNDAFATDVPATNSDASNGQAFFPLLNNDISTPANTEATSYDIFAGMDQESSNSNDLFAPLNTQPSMNDQFGSFIEQNSFGFGEFGNTNDPFLFDECSVFDSSADFSHMVQQATTQIQSPGSGAVRQREALEEHERRAAEGRRR